MKVLTCREEMKQMQKVHSTVLQAIMATMSVPDATQAELSDTVSFPLKSTDNIRELKDKLSDEENQKHLVDMLYYCCFLPTAL